MALVTKNFTLNVTPGAMPPTIHVSEYDIGRTYTITILDENGSAFEIPTGTTAAVEGTLNGTYGFTTSATISGNQISFALTESMTAYAGNAWCKIKLTLNSEPIQTCAFVLAVDRAGVEADTVIGADGFEEQIVDAVNNWLDLHPPSGGGGSSGGGGGSAVGAVLYNMPQSLNEAQKAQARQNIGAAAPGEAVADLPFVTPEQFGALGDGSTDDSMAIQSALNSGHPVVFEQKTYKIASPVEVDNANGIIVDFNGAKIHVASSATTTYGLVFHDCENILLQNLFMYSDLDQVGASHESERNTFSNVLGVTFKDCSNIVCSNVQFENLSSDFWMQHTNSQILIDGWISNNCAMPMYAERSQHMRVTNFYHKPLTGLSNYYHCFYLYGQTDDIQIDHGSMVALDAYLGPLFNCGYSQSSTTEKVTNLRVEECTMVYGISAIWTQNVDEVSFSNCTILPVNSSAHRLASGNSDLSFVNCKIKIYQWGFQSGTGYNSKLLFDGCEIEGLHASSLISQNAYDLAFRNCTIIGCSLAYHGSNSGEAIVKGCVIRCNSTITIENLFRNTSGQEVVFEDCYFVGNGTVRYVYYTGDKDSAGMRVHNCFAYDFRDVTYNSESAEFIGVYLDGIPVAVKYAAFNRIPVSIDTDGTVFNQIGYIDGYRLGSGGVLREQSGSIVTGFMPFKNGDLYELSNMEWEPRSADGDIYCYVTVFDSNFQYLGELNNNNAKGGVVKNTSSVVKSGSKYTVNIDSDSNQIAYLRVSAVWDSSMGTPTAIRKNKE